LKEAHKTNKDRKDLNHSKFSSELSNKFREELIRMTRYLVNDLERQLDTKQKLAG